MNTAGEADQCSLVIFGGSGDLAMRMLFPSLYFLEADGLLPPCLKIIAAARSQIEKTEFLQTVREKFGKFRPADRIDPEAWARFADRLVYVALDITDPASFGTLAEEIGSAPSRETIFYLATSPTLYGSICSNLKQAGLVTANARVVMEKPIGQDLKTFTEIDDGVSSVFDEDCIFRVDHYLGKETVQNLLVMRFANMLFEPLWNSRGIDHVQITISETVGVGSRWNYYNESGAMRDMVQNHMLQLLCLVAMEPPTNLDANAVRDEKVKVLRSLRPLTMDDIRTKTVRGQYTNGMIEGEAAPGYLEEGGGQESLTETFVALRADIENWRWSGVPFYLRTGKRLPNRFTEIFIRFKEVPHSIFPGYGNSQVQANSMIIRLQPEEEIKLHIVNKVPGLGRDGMRLQAKPLNLNLSDAFQAQQTRRRIAYERLLLDLIDGNNTLFVRRDEIEAAWRWTDTILKGWAELETKPVGYSAGTWGPSASIGLTERNGHTWLESIELT